MVRGITKNEWVPSEREQPEEPLGGIASGCVSGRCQHNQDQCTRSARSLGDVPRVVKVVKRGGYLGLRKMRWRSSLPVQARVLRCPLTYFPSHNRGITEFAGSTTEVLTRQKNVYACYEKRVKEATTPHLPLRLSVVYS